MVRRIIFWSLLAFHSISFVLAVTFYYFLKDPGFQFNDLTVIALGANLIFFILTIAMYFANHGGERRYVAPTKSTEDTTAKLAGGLVGSLVLMLACLSPYIDVFRYADFCQHKGQIAIESVVCEGLTQGSDGKDYFDFAIDVSFKKHEVNNFDVHTLVFKGDKFIGYIESNFLGTSSHHSKSHYGKYFESNSKQTLKFRISHTRGYSWDGDELFKELYYGNLEDYTFVSKVIYVQFYDGTIVGRALDYYYDDYGKLHYNDID